MDKELKKIKELAQKKARQTPFYKQLTKRTYRRIKGYLDYKQIACELSSHLMCLETGFELRGFSDTAWNAMSHSAWMAYESPLFPVFAITKELAQAFLATDLPPHVCGLNRSFRNALFLLPELVRTPDNYLCQWAFVSHFVKGESVESLPKTILKNFSPEALKQVERLKSPPFEVGKLRWVSQVGQLATIYSSIMELPEEGDKPITGEIDFGGNLEFWGENVNPETEQQFTRAVDKLLLQTLLYLQLKPDAVSSTPPSSHQSGNGFRGKADPHTPLEPIWIGKDYKPQMIGKSHGSHASPRLHWRRGHWKRVAVGEGRRDRRWHWIEPTLVNAD
jgi:hypothetical protein